MLVQVVGVPVLELGGALASRGGLRLLHPWNMDSRTFGHDTAEAVPESRQHSSRELYVQSAPLFTRTKEKRLHVFPASWRGTIAKMTTVAEDVLSRPVYVSINHRLFPLNNKSRVTTTDCGTALVEKKGRGGGGERAIKDARHTSTAVKCHGKLEGEIFPYNIPFVIA